MKILIHITTTLIIFFLLAGNTIAGPFIKIKSINADKNSNNLEIHTTVKNINNMNIGGLDESNLLVYEDGYRVNYVKVNNLSKSNDVLYLVFSLDSSWSISNLFLKSIKKAAKTIINSSDPRDRIAIYKFNDKIKLLNNFTANKHTLIKNINKIMRHGHNTLLYDSIYDSLNLLKDEQGKRKGIIVFTDGKDEGSSVKIKDIISLSNIKEIPVYFISFKHSKNIRKLARISKLTGGKLVYSSRPDQVAGMYKTILSFIKSKYIIQYKTLLKGDGKKHIIEVRLAYGDLKDRDTREVTYSSSLLSGQSGSTQTNTFLIVLIGILLLLLLIMVIYFIFKEKSKLASAYNTTPDLTSSDLPHIRSSYKQKAAATDNTDNYDFSPIEEELQTSKNVNKQKTDDSINVKPTDENLYAVAWLIEKAGTSITTKHPIYKEEFIIGSDNSCNIIIPRADVSAKHAKIQIKDDNFYLLDLISDSGTYLNGKKLLRPKSLFDWDEIKIGKTTFIFRGSK